jgi:hypothetical protein
LQFSHVSNVIKNGQPIGQPFHLIRHQELHPSSEIYHLSVLSPTL